MGKNTFGIGLIGLIVLALGCHKETQSLLQKTKSREQTESAVKEMNKLEDDTKQLQKLQQIEQESDKIIHFNESQ
ncbi:MAG: hypothetical protein V2A64_05090 [Candidatus Omnitrophota bacterium]